MKRVQFEVMSRTTQARWETKCFTIDEALRLQEDVEANNPNTQWADTCILRQDVEFESVADLFKARLGRLPEAIDFNDLPVDSECGRECKTVILAAEQMIHVCDRLTHELLIDVAERAVSILYLG